MWATRHPFPTVPPASTNVIRFVLQPSPTGGLFTITGALLVIYGLVSDPAIYEKSLGINVNLWWGVVLLVFGLAMLVLAFQSRSQA